MSGFSFLRPREGEDPQYRVPGTPEITVRIDKQFGNEVIVPVCDDAKIFARIAGTKTLTGTTILHIKALGYTVRVQPDERVTL